MHPSRAGCGLVPAPTARETAAPTAGPRNLFIVLVLAGVLLPSPVGPVMLVVAAVVAIRYRMRPWVPAVLVAGAITLASYTVLTAPAAVH